MRAGTSQAAISDIERGRGKPSVETVERLLQCLGYQLRLEADDGRMYGDVHHLRSALSRSPAERLHGVSLFARQIAELRHSAVVPPEDDREGSSTPAYDAGRAEPPRSGPIDFAAILDALLAEEVEFLITGGVAANLYASARMSADLDIIRGPGSRNTARLARALTGLQARPMPAPGPGAGRAKRKPNSRTAEDSFDSTLLSNRSTLRLLTRHGDLDVITRTEGMRPWPELAERAWRAPLGEGREVLVVGRDDLIAMKRARGRSHDRSDIVELTSARRRAQQQARTRVAITVPLKPGVEDRKAKLVAGDWTELREKAHWRVEAGPDRSLVIEADLRGYDRADATGWAKAITRRLEAARLHRSDIRQHYW